MYNTGPVTPFQLADNQRMATTHLTNGTYLPVKLAKVHTNIKNRYHNRSIATY